MQLVHEPCIPHSKIEVRILYIWVLETIIPDPFEMSASKHRLVAELLSGTPNLTQTHDKYSHYLVPALLRHKENVRLTQT